MPFFQKSKSILLGFLLFIGAYSVAGDNEEQQQEAPTEGLTKERIIFDLGNVNGFVNFMYKPETFFGKNINLLNNNNRGDRVFYNRSTFDANVGVAYGKKYYGHNAMEFYTTFRHKVIWGNPGTSAVTNKSEIKLLDAVLGEHNHRISKQFPWIREIWLKFNINDALCLSFNNQHWFTLGSFPFQLGRGIALGAAYAVNPGILGFYSDDTIDQYAYGFNFSGEFISCKLGYDLYGAILENFGDSGSRTGQKIYGQRIGRELNQFRGPGHINFIAAGKLKWKPIANEDMSINIEPYGLYNNDPEGDIEFTADSSTNLATFGLAAEFKAGNFEWGFDGAFNIGAQTVYPWDRNKVSMENRNSFVQMVNSEVVVADPTVNPKAAKAEFIPKSDNQKAVNTTSKAQVENGKAIPGTNPQWFNSINRFRNGYTNKLKGWMVVGDIAYNFCEGDIKLAATAGMATGDENPNKDLDNPGESDIDRVFSGFIGLQEIYTGYRVRSAFLLGGAGRIPRPLSAPSNPAVVDRFPSVTSGFTNLVFSGLGMVWQPQEWERYAFVNPNLLTYWQQYATRKWDRETQLPLPNERARNFLGTEMNIFTEVELLKDFKFYAVGSVFFPGGHYKDIKGQPLNKDQQNILDELDVTGIDNDKVPLLGDDIAYTFNIGLEARF